MFKSASLIETRELPRLIARKNGHMIEIDGMIYINDLVHDFGA